MGTALLLFCIIEEPECRRLPLEYESELDSAVVCDPATGNCNCEDFPSLPYCMSGSTMCKLNPELPECHDCQVNPYAKGCSEKNVDLADESFCSVHDPTCRHYHVSLSVKEPSG